jgi:O-antigen/teichoic acid export membrane protein
VQNDQGQPLTGESPRLGSTLEEPGGTREEPGGHSVAMGTPEGRRGPVRPTRRMPRLHSHRALGRSSESAAGEPIESAEQPVRPPEQALRATGLPVRPPEPPVQPTDLPVQPSKLLAHASKLLAQPTELRRLFTNFGYLVAKQGATAVLGFVYWAIATHLFSPQDVGLAAAASSTAFFLGAIGALGIPLLLVAELDSLPPADRRVTFSTGMYISCLAVLILSLGTVTLSPFLGGSLRVICADSTTAALFVIGSVATMGALTFDNAAVGLHRGSAQLWRGSLTSVLKLAVVGVLVLIGIRTASGLLFAWAVTLVVSFVCIPVLRLEPTPPGEGNLSRRVALVRRYGVLSLKHHILNLSINSVFYIVGAIAALLILPRQLAYFSTAFLVESTAMVIPYLLALSLFAEIASDQTLLHRHIRRTLPLGLALCGGIVVVAEVAAPLILRIFGPSYAMNGSTALRLLVLVGPAYVIKDHYVAIRRAQGRLGHAAKVMAAGTCAETAGAVLGGIYWGTTGLSLGWVVAASCEAVVLLPAVLRVFNRDPLAEPDAGRPSR